MNIYDFKPNSILMRSINEINEINEKRKGVQLKRWYFIQPIFAIIIIAIFAISFSEFAYAKDLQAGVSPIVLPLGNISKGTSVVGSFFIVTASTDEILVKLDSQRSNIDYFKKPEYLGIADKVSEEDSSGWVFFPTNPYVLRHTNESLKTIGGNIADWKKVSFILKIPEGAEPCNHALHIRPNPYVAEEYGTAVNIVVITAITVMFNVEGICEINGRILDIFQNEKPLNGMVNIDVYFQNTGTATISAHAPSISLYYENGTLIDSQQSGRTYVKPGELKILSAKFPANNFLEEGMYTVNATVVYGVNSTSREATILIKHPKIIYATNDVQKIESTRSNYIFWLILVIIAAIAYRIYKGDGKEQDS